MNDLTPTQQMALVEISKHGRGSEITGAQLANLIGLKERRTGKEGADMRSVIHALRVKNFPICANGKGYYYAKTESELIEYITSLQGRVDTELKAIYGLKQSVHNVGKRYGFTMPGTTAIATQIPPAFPQQPLI